MRDPFAGIRPAWETVKLDNLHDADDKQSFDVPTDEQRLAAHAAIKDLYKEHAWQSGDPNDGSLTDEWIQTIATALAQTHSFHRLYLESEVGITALPPIKVHLDIDWLSGWYLRGFYEAHDNFFMGYQDFFQKRQGEIVAMANAQVENALSSTRANIDLKTRSVPCEFADVVKVDRHLLSLLQLVQQEKDVDVNCDRLMRAASSLGPVLQKLPQTAALLEGYRATVGPKTSDNAIDRFGGPCLALLSDLFSESKDMTPLGDLTEDEKEHISRATASDVAYTDLAALPSESDDGEDSDVEEPDDDEEQEDQSTVPTLPEEITGASQSQGGSSATVVNNKARVEWLHDFFDAQERPITYPCWSAPATGPFTLEQANFEALGIEMPDFGADAAADETR